MLLKTASCPNPNCKNHSKEGKAPVHRWFTKHGKYYSKNGIKPRYICLECGKTFSLTYYNTKSYELEYFDLNEIVKKYKQGVNLVEIAKSLDVNESILFKDIEAFL